MSEEGMDKYGVQLDETKVKESSPKGKKKAGTCPDCGKSLDSGGACPRHGTKPFEPTP